MNKTPQSFHKIRFSDCDMLGHLNNSRYIDYLIDGREDHLLHEYGFQITDWYAKGIGWVIGGHEIAYLKPALYNETVCIESTLLSFEEDYLWLETRMLNKEKSHLKALMRTRMIPVNIRDGKRLPHPQDLLEWAAPLTNPEAQAQLSFDERVASLAREIKSAGT